MAAERKRRKVETAASRTMRLLSLVAYLSKHDSATLTELAHHFGVTEKQIRADVDLLWVTGTPGYMADDLIDFDGFALDHGVVRLTAARGLGSTLRLGVKESIALLAALNAVRLLFTDEADQEAIQLVDRLIAKLSLSLGENARAIDIQLTEGTNGPTVRTLRAGIEQLHPVRIDYVDFAGARTTRTIEPWSVFNDSGHFYVNAYCQTANGPRVFRIDRISSAELLDTEELSQERDQSPGDARVPAVGNIFELKVSPSGRWLTEEIPHESVDEEPDGTLRMRLDVARPEWLKALLGSHADVILSVQPADIGLEVAERAESALLAYENEHLMDQYTDASVALYEVLGDEVLSGEALSAGAEFSGDAELSGDAVTQPPQNEGSVDV